ncbi:vacuolar protein sorting-associated protein 9A-like isoform X2 [Juglans microcarpa x Juglans regia]|uniref:vacuolar protein sorting-associated protein 9A-like isoform X2 n=1 Tax=Juglans microcarpa x Juglans regia TaxID=2249226 RepID=UPI001B7E9151|nr:vacuolar protein sorting-associated protein 9A-like isoform X2 [Juglans microcarpa x Juglans regia]
MESSAAAASSVTFYDFLDRMRNPASLDLVRSIKSFIVSSSFYAANPENDGKRVQEFYLTMEAAIREHPLWTGASEEEVDHAMEGLEKYVMTKLFSRTFASASEDSKIDHEISEKICLLQTFLKPEHLDIPAVLQNEASWLANPPQLHSNLKFIQLYRRQAKLVSEAAYYFTNLVSAKEFIVDLSAKSLSMDEIKFEESMQAARLTNKEMQTEASTTLLGQTDPSPTRILDENRDLSGGSNYPYMDAKAGELTIGDVERLLSLYKDVVTKYTNLRAAVRHHSLSKAGPPFPHSEGTSFSLTRPEGVNTKIDHQRGN